MKKFLFKYWYFLILLVPLMLFIYSIWDSNYYIGGDLIIPLNPSNDIKKPLLWENGVESFNYAELLLRTFYYGFSIFGLQAFVIQKILLVLLLVAGFTCTYLSHKELFKDTVFGDVKYSYLAGVVFTFNPAYYLVVIGYLPLYGFPICFYFFLKYLSTKKVYSAIFFSLSINFFFFTEWPQPKLSIIFGLSVIFLTFLYQFLHPDKRRKIIINLFKIISISVLLNLWIIIPTLGSLFLGTLGSISTNIINHDGLADFKVASLQYIVNFINLNTIRYYPKLQTYLTSFLFISFSNFQWILLITSIFLIKNSRRYRKFMCYIILYILVLIFIAKGANPPLGEVYKFSVTKIPLLSIFRTTSSVVLGAMFFYACAVSISSYYFSKRFKYFVYIYAICIILISYPIYFGYKFYNQASNLSGSRGYHIPEQYFEIGKRLDEIKDGSKVLSQPLIQGYVSKNWSYFGPDLLNQITGKQILYRSDLYGLSLKKTNTIKTQGSYVSPLLNNIGYILLQKDSINNNISIYNNIGTNTLEHTDKYFDLYKIPNDRVIPQIYVQSDAVYLSGDISKLQYITSFSNFQKKSGIYVASSSSKPYKTGQEFNYYTSIGEGVDKPLEQRALEWDSGWAWPNARINPLSLKYKILNIKEYLDITKSKKLIDRVDVLLWFSAKRVEELRIYRLPPKIQNSIIANYAQLNFKIMTNLTSVEKKDRNADYWDMVRKTYMYMGKASNIFLSLGYKTNNSKDPVTLYNDFANWIESNSNLWCNEYCYNLSVPRDGQYAIYLNKEDLSDYNDRIEEININIKDLGALRINEVGEDGWYKFTSVELKKEMIYKVNLNLPKSINIVNSGDWRDISTTSNVVDLNMFSKSISYSYIAPNTKNLGIDPQVYGPLSNPKYKVIDKWSNSKKYRVSLDYYTDSGSADLALIERRLDESGINVTKNTNTSIKTLFEEKLKQSNKQGCYYKEGSKCFTHYEKIVSSSIDANQAIIFIYAAPELGKFSEIMIRNLSVEKVLDPTIILKTNKTYNEAVTPQKLTMTFLKINNTKYKINIKNVTSPYTLVFNEGFHRGWKLYLNSNVNKNDFKNAIRTRVDKRLVLFFQNLFKKRTFETQSMENISDNTHYTVNGFANSWRIEPSIVNNLENYELIVEFEPQQIFNLSVVISTIAFITILIFSAVDGLLSIRKSRGNS